MEYKKIKALENIYKINFGIKRNEKALVFSDNFNSNTRKIGKLVAETGKKFTESITYYVYPTTGCHGVEPPEDLWAEAFGKEVYAELKEKNLFQNILSKKTTEKQLDDIERTIRKYKDKSVNVVIALSYYSTSHTKFRDLLCRICGVRYASMPLFDETMLTGPMTVNWEKMKDITTQIAKRVNRCQCIKVESGNGTSILLSKEGREAKMDTGIITRPGQFSNLPAGEVYLAPLEGTTTGRLVLEWAPTRKLKSPVTLHLEKGEVKKIEGSEKYISYLEEKFAEKRANRNIAELGIGTNDKASRPDNILESEKILGTVHVALGDNSSFGGKVKTSFHQDFVLFKPTITLIYKKGIKRKLMEHGKLLAK
ncbi:MAG: aminopeptidase [Nitrospirae bacterium]|nr:aminopeptidase [Nitrospirota bacterium]